MDTLTATPVTAPVETVTPLRPSEAMRLGRLVVPKQTESQMFDDIVVSFERHRVGIEEVWKVGSACALGAMAIGFGKKPRDIGQAGYWWPDGYSAPRTTCPMWESDVCNDEPQTVMYVVSHLNDTHRWHSERIATWLEGLGL